MNYPIKILLNIKASEIIPVQLGQSQNEVIWSRRMHTEDSFLFKQVNTIPVR